MKIAGRSLLTAQICLTLLIFWPGRVACQPQTEKVRVERLVKLCRLWGKVKYFHPALAYRRDIDWDKALVDAIPRVNAARTPAEYGAALQSMLEVLGDPSTAVIGNEEQNSANHLKENLEYRLTEDKILVVHAGSYFALYGPASQQRLAEITKQIPNARAVVLDLRAASAGGALW